LCCSVVGIELADPVAHFPSKAASIMPCQPPLMAPRALIQPSTRASNILDMLSASGTVIDHPDPLPVLTKRNQADVYHSKVSLSQAELWEQARQTAFNNLARDLGEEEARRLCDLAPWYFDNERLWVLGYFIGSLLDPFV